MQVFYRKCCAIKTYYGPFRKNKKIHIKNWRDKLNESSNFINSTWVNNFMWEGLPTTTTVAVFERRRIRFRDAPQKFVPRHLHDTASNTNGRFQTGPFVFGRAKTSPFDCLTTVARLCGGLDIYYPETLVIYCEKRTNSNIFSSVHSAFPQMHNAFPRENTPLRSRTNFHPRTSWGSRPSSTWR